MTRKPGGVAVLLAALVLALLVGPAAGSAAAQTLSGQGPTDFRTVMTTPVHPAPGLTVRIVENGARIEVTNTGAEPVVVLGYLGEPFLRIARDGVDENTQSPAVALSAKRWGGVAEHSLNPYGPPDWHRTSSGSTATWYDRRIHWPLDQRLPLPVVEHPGSAQRVLSWTVPMSVGAQAVDVSGDLRWVPGPSPWPGIAAAMALAVLVCAAGAVAVTRMRSPRRAGAVLGATVLGATGLWLLHLALVAWTRTGGFTARLGAFFGGNLLQLLAAAAALAGGTLLVRGRTAGAWLAVPGAAALALRVVGYDLPVLWRSSSPFTGPIVLDRGMTVVALGCAAGVLVPLTVLVRRTTTAQALAARAAALPSHDIPDDTVDDIPGEDLSEESTMARTPAPRTPVHDAGQDDAETDTQDGVSRRRLLAVAGAAGAGGLAVGAGVTLLSDGGSGGSSGGTPLTTLGSSAVAFNGTRQAGIATPGQASTVLTAFDLEPGADRAAVAALMRKLSDESARMTRGDAPDQDDQIALDAGPSSLSITFGFGASLFDRIGLTDRRPASLRALPQFVGDALDPARSDGDLLVQVCADDALVAHHAARMIVKFGRGTVRVRWNMTGFSRSPGATPKPMTARNLMGQIDGTGNPKPTDAGFDAKIFVGADSDQAWARDGSYVVVRRIRMLLDDWEGLDVPHQERIIGRRKDTGAPLTGGVEGTPIDFGRTNPDGTPVIPADAHIRVSAPEFNRGATMVRRGFSYHDGFLPDGSPDAGLLFLAWQADPFQAFVPVQTKLALGDALSPFLRHESSALFFAPPGAAAGSYVGAGLLEA